MFIQRVQAQDQGATETYFWITVSAVLDNSVFWYKEVERDMNRYICATLTYSASLFLKRKHNKTNE
eukprot:gene10114-7080_t